VSDEQEFVGERGGRLGRARVHRGPSTAQLAKCASCSAQDDSKNRQRRRTGIGNDEGEMRGSPFDSAPPRSGQALHCATDDQAVRCSGRDDGVELIPLMRKERA